TKPWECVHPLHEVTAACHMGRHRLLLFENTTKVQSSQEPALRATFIHGVRDLRLGDKPEPERKADDVLVRVSGVGICGSDLHYYMEGGIGSALIRKPFVPGHEFAGRVVD